VGSGEPDGCGKVWPINRDRVAVNTVMGATPPVDYAATGHTGERMVEAHRFFGAQRYQVPARQRRRHRVAPTR
jgi:hypothetical protein